VRVYFDENTTVGYQGQTYRVSDLERGDEVSVRVDESGNQLRAESMTVLRDVSGGSSSSYPGSGVVDSTVRGTVRYVDTSRRTIELESATWASRFSTGNTSSRPRRHLVRLEHERRCVWTAASCVRPRARRCDRGAGLESECVDAGCGADLARTRRPQVSSVGV
jgi:hypothetical protein